MKKNVFKLIALSGLMLVAVSCNKDYLVEEPSEFVTLTQLEDAAATNPAIVRGTMDGIYATMVQTGTGGTTGHDDFGHKAYDIFSDFLCGDMALSVSTYGWYRASITEFQCTQDFTFGDNRQVWQYYFTIIRSANTVIATLGGNDADPQIATNRHILGQAFAMRAHSYFYLTQYMANDYNPQAPILPLLDEVINVGLPKSTTAEIYQLMESDLNRAIVLLDGFNRPTKNQVNKQVAQAMLAYVIASTRDSARWGEVAALTQSVIDNSGATMLTPAQVTGGFNDVNTPSWIWGADLTIDTGLGLVSWWGQMDAFTYSYAWAGDAKAIDRTLYNSIPANDARKAQFYAPAGYYNLMPLNKFYDPNRVIGGQTTITTDYVYMRIEEMVLLNAEALAKNNQDGPARERLRTLMAQRLPSTTYLDALSGQALKDEIYKQTRVELWGEGKSYLALKRNQATATRGNNHLSFVGVPVPHNDERMTFEIPEREIQDNPFINDQN